MIVCLSIHQHGCLWYLSSWCCETSSHDDVIKSIHRSPVNSPYKGQWCGALMFSVVYAWINGWGWWFKTPSRPLWCHCYVSEQIGGRGIPQVINYGMCIIHTRKWIKSNGVYDMVLQPKANKVHEYYRYNSKQMSVDGIINQYYKPVQSLCYCSYRS